MARILLLLAVTAMVAWSCNVFSIDDEFVYPTKLKQLPIGTLQQLNEEFQASNNNHICSTLNEYGLTGYSTVLFQGKNSPCENRDQVRIELTRPDTLLSAAIESLIINSRYTGVKDTTSLKLHLSEPLMGCIICEGPNIDSKPIEWKFVFDIQVLDGYRIKKTSVSVIIDAAGVNRIWGNWYNEFYIPERPNVELSEAINLLVGREITWSVNGADINYKIESGSVYNNAEKVIVPYRNGSDIELRTGWKLNVNADIEILEGWHIYVDVMEGQILMIEEMINEHLTTDL